MVTFSAGPTVLGTGTLSTTGSVTTATYTYTPAAPSASPVIITAAYAGDSGYAPSTAAGSNLSVTGFSASVTGTTTSITVTSGATTGNTATLSFTPIGPFTGTVNFNCTISNGTAVYPPTCALSAPSINLTPGTPASVTITIITTTPKASSGGVEHTFLYKTGGVVFAMLVCLLPFRRHRLIRPLMSVIFLTGVLASPCSCSSGGGSMQTLHGSAGSYTITVTGTSGNTSATVNIPLTVN